MTTDHDLVREIEAVGNASGYEEACARLLHVLRRHVGMDVAWTSEFVGHEQVFRFVDAEPAGQAPTVGDSTPLNDAYCSRVLNGTMPALIPNTHEEATAIWLGVTFSMHIGSYLGVPLHGVDGLPNGMLCLISAEPSPELDQRALDTARLVAQVLDDLHHRALGESAARERRSALHAEVAAACRGDGRSAVLQPIVHLGTGVTVAAEGLTRFATGTRTPAGWFAAAHSVGLGPDLEIAAARGALARLADHDAPPALAVNLSPAVAMSALAEVIGDVEVSRVVVEITEYAPVPDYEALQEALAPFRARGLRIAVDDAGAGYASLTHVLRLQPDVVKVDMSLVRDIDSDPVRQALVSALVRFAAVAEADVVAEGVETMAELAALAELGVRFGQGYLFGRPCEHPVYDGLPHHDAATL